MGTRRTEQNSTGPNVEPSAGLAVSKLDYYLCGAAAILNGKRFQPHIGPTKDVHTQMEMNSTHKLTPSVCDVLIVHLVQLSSGLPMRISLELEECL